LILANPFGEIRIFMANNLKQTLALTAAVLLSTASAQAQTTYAQETYTQPAYAQETYTQPAYALEVQKQGDVSFVSGGIGEDETAALKAVQNRYNLRILNADKTGHYSGDIHIMVKDSKQTTVLDTVGGPFIYANLPSGRYVVEGASQGESRKQAVSITGKTPAKVRFTWPPDANE